MRAPRPPLASLLLTLVALHLPVAAAAAQGIAVSGGAGLALADYREQGTALRFRGTGPSGHVAAGWRRFGLRVDATRLTLEGAGPAGTTSEPFDLTQLDVRVSVRVAHAVSIETGLLSRVVSPRDAAQEVGAARVGARVDYALAPGAALTARAGYLGAARFSGGGAAPFGIEAGLGVSYGPGQGRIRVTTDFDFQRFDRRTSVGGERLGVPIQSGVARIGVELRL